MKLRFCEELVIGTRSKKDSTFEFDIPGADYSPRIFSFDIPSISIIKLNPTFHLTLRARAYMNPLMIAASAFNIEDPAAPMTVL